MNIQYYTDDGYKTDDLQRFIEKSLNNSDTVEGIICTISSVLAHMVDKKICTVEEVNKMLPYCGQDMETIPKPTVDLKSCWVHTNGNEYIVQLIVNVDSTNDKYPPTVVYKNAHNGKGYSRPLSDWHRSMTRYKVKL